MPFLVFGCVSVLQELEGENFKARIRNCQLQDLGCSQTWQTHEPFHLNSPSTPWVSCGVSAEDTLNIPQCSSFSDLGSKQ